MGNQNNTNTKRKHLETENTNNNQTTNNTQINNQNNTITLTQDVNKKDESTNQNSEIILDSLNEIFEKSLKYDKNYGWCLDLDRKLTNHIEQEDIEKLFLFIEKSQDTQKKIIWLSIDHNNLGPEHGDIMLNYFNLNKDIKFISFNENNLNYQTKNLINKIIEENRDNPQGAHDRVSSMLNWSPWIHHRFSKSFQNSVFAFMLCLKKNQKFYGIKVPKYIVWEILKNFKFISYNKSNF